MCGIVGILSADSSWETKSILYRALAELVNRGYDSMGVSMIIDEEKDSKQFLLKKSLDKDDLFQFMKLEKKDTKNCVGHTRWATHGGVTVENAHPHLDTINNEFSIVHNGIIENYECLKRNLVKKGISFHSQTDSEVIVNLIAYTFHHLFSSIMNRKERLEKSLSHILSQLEGTYAIIVQDLEQPHHLYCARKGSPLLIGFNQEQSCCLIVSEKSGFLDHVSSYMSLTDHSLYGLIRMKDKIHYVVLQEKQPSTLSLFEMNPEECLENGFEPYSCFTEKEIYEQPNAILRCFNFGARFRQEMVFLGGLKSVEKQLRECRHMYIFGCGTSYHVALLAQTFFLDTMCFDSVMAFDASEFELRVLPIVPSKCCCLFITQSGETLDLFTILQQIQTEKKEYLTLGIVNVVDSLIAKTVHAGVYMNCYRERGVASTKSFTNSVLLCWMIAQWFRHDPISKEIVESMLFPSLLEDFISHSMTRAHQLAETLSDCCSSILGIGRGKDFCIAKEGCLKIKELSYAHAEAFSSSSLKHGPFALLHSQMLVFFIATDTKWFTKASNSFYEVYARRPRLVVLCTPSFRQLLRQDLEGVIFIDVPELTWSFLFANIFFQCFAFHLAKSKGIDPDFPRNLAKVVTVE